MKQCQYLHSTVIHSTQEKLIAPAAGLQVQDCFQPILTLSSTSC